MTPAFKLQNHKADWPPENTVFPVARIDLTVIAGDHPFHLSEAKAARENWKKEIAANPALFDGRMIFQHRLSVSEAGCGRRSVYHAVFHIPLVA